MNRRIKVVLLAGGLIVVASTATVVMLGMALARSFDSRGQCATGFSTWVDCSYHVSTSTVGQSSPIFTTPSNSTEPTPSSSWPEPGYHDVTSWGIVQCPQNSIARRLLCAVPSAAAPAQAASDDLATGLPRPMPWFLTMAKNSPFIESLHVETPLALATVLGFYRAELGKRGWTEDGGASIEPDRAVIAFTTSDGPAQLRLIHQDDRTIVDLSRRKPATAAYADIRPKPGQVKLLLGNATDEAAVITVDGQSVQLAAHADRELRDNLDIEKKSPDNLPIDLSPGAHKITLKLANGATANREFEVAADETWGLLVGPADVPLPIRLY
jgi:hypothetical protein